MTPDRPSPAKYSYARTSGPTQVAGLEDQIAELSAAGCTRIFSEHVSAVERHRPELESALDWLRSGDTFIVTKPDRLARSVTVWLGVLDFDHVRPPGNGADFDRHLARGLRP